MQLSFVGRDDHNEDNVMEVTVPGKNDIKEYGRQMVGRHVEDEGCWFKANMVEFGVLWEQDMALLGMIKGQLYSEPHFTCDLQIMSLFFIPFLGWNNFNFYN